MARGCHRRTRSGATGLARFRAWPRAILLAVSLGLTGPAAAAADEPWTKVSTDRFTILTPAGEAVARKWAIELEQFRRGLQAAVPVSVDRLRPVTVVLFKRDRAMDDFAPLENGQPVRIGGFFVRANDINTIMLSIARPDRETRRVIFHEAVHWHLSARDGVMPLWLAEGLAEMYATFEVPDARTCVFGATFDEHVTRLQSESLLPLPKLLGIGRDSLLYNEGTRTTIFYAQSWALVHFLFYGEKSPGRAAVHRYLELLPVVRSPDDAFTTAFGASYASVEKQLRRYITEGRYQKHVYSRATDDIARELRVGRAAPADVALAKGSLLLGARSAEEAELHLRRAAELAPADPRAWELLGNIAVRRRDFATALAFLTKAVAVGSTSYLAFHNLALARVPELAQPWVPNSAIDPDALGAAASDFRRAIQLSPSHVPSYEGLAGLMHALPAFAPADIDLLSRGLTHAPGNAMIEAGIAAGDLRAGREAEGRARLERLEARDASSNSPGYRFARRLLENERRQGELEQIHQLIRDNRLDEVMALTERALERDGDPATRHALERARRQATALIRIRTAVALANDGQPDRARAELGQVLADRPEPAVEHEAQRVLREIDRRALE